MGQMTINLSSDVLKENSFIPEKYTCDGENINPPLSIKNLPRNSKSLVLIVDDPDAPAGTWVHWVVWNIPVTGFIAENTIPGIEGVNDFKKNHYGGPCPPSGTHRYFFKIYALDTMLHLSGSVTKYKLEKAMQHHLLSQGELIGLYQRKRKEVN